MNREILFRGLRTDGKGWVCGYYHKDPEDGCFIADFEYVNVSGSFDEPPSGYFKKVLSEVIPESVGQFTGLKNKNGTNIFDGDNTNFGIVVFENGSFGIYSESCFIPLFDWNLSEIEITGNIHENK